MSTALTIFDGAQMPAHLAVLEEKANVLERDTTPAITFRGKTWRLRQGGEEIVLQRKNNEGEMEPAPTVNVVVLNVNQKRSRMFFAGAYVEGQNQQPACWSSDGERPDKDVPAPVATTCASCPNSVKGSKITAQLKETTACAPLKRLAVTPASKLDMEPLLLKVPQTSLWDKNNAEAEAQGYFAWDQYVDFLRQRNVKHTAAVVTRIKFDQNVAYPKLLFTAVRWLEANEVAMIAPLVESDAVKKLLSGKIHDGTEVAEASASAPAAAPATPVTPIAAKPAPTPVQAADDDAFSNVGAAPATPAPAATAAAPAKPPAAAKPQAAPKPPAPPPPKPPVVPAAAAAGTPSVDLAALAASWDD